MTPDLGPLVWRTAALLPLVVASTLAPAAPAALGKGAATPCQFLTPSGAPSPIQHVIHIQFDNVHFTRDNPNVPSDLEQMPHLLNFIKENGTLLTNEHTPLIAHTAHDFVTGMTGVYGDQTGIAVSGNSFEYYNNSPVGSYNTSAFTYWTDRIAPDPANPARALPFEMLDSAGNNIQAPWVPFVNAGCNFGAVSTANMVLENNGNDVNQVFGAGSPEASEAPADRTNDFVGIAVHCADATCASVGSGAAGHAKPELGGQGVAALYGHKYVASQVSPITEIDGTPITGFNQANTFNPTPNYTLGYLLALLQANVPVVYGEIEDAHDSGNRCAATTAANPKVADTNNGKPCGAFAPGEPGYVQQLKDFDTAFAGFFARLDALGINPSNTLFVIHADENDHYAGTPPLNPGCDGVTTPCHYDRTRVGEVTTDLPLLLRQQQLYDFASGRPGFGNADLPYAIDFDTAPGFWLKGHPADGSPPSRKLEGGLARVTAFNPYTNATEPLFRFLIDGAGLKALHMLSADPDRTPGVVGFGAVDHFVQTTPLISSGNSGCNVFPAATDAVCLSNGFIWLHGNFAPDIDTTWAGLVGPGVAHKGVDNDTFADHSDLRPTMFALLCLKDAYTHEGRALLEDLQDSALPPTVAASRGQLTSLGSVFKQINAPVGEFGQGAIQVSTRAIKGSDATYARLEDRLQELVTRRDALAGQIEAQLDPIAGCGRVAAQADDRGERGDRGQGGGDLQRLIDQGRDLLESMRDLARREDAGQS